MSRPRPFEDLVRIMADLRAEGGCPWDREQTHETLRPYLIEETHEVIGAIEAGSDADLAEELGDLLLQVVFHARIAEEEGRFTIRDVIGRIHEKLVRRHPHVFGDVRADTPEKVLRNWEAIKLRERAGENTEDENPPPPSVLDGVPASLPALLKAQRVQAKAGRVGFDWKTPEGPLAKVREEIEEIEGAIRGGETEGVEREMGDLLFALVNVARHLKVDAEGALRVCVDRFMGRFRYIEGRLAERGLTAREADLAVLDALWDEAKGKE
ncbi:MAG: nucleoside triphosphate pyrophosphohydrolase [Nitrospinota bacterium]|nr:nucleoside triphosphate pyrophosphohydrolase [Nitrospinota bacterium]MDP7385332.1 nucleoside triphosphate pyrophosphohydrolase [Nitrospinota bacterium]HJM44256.1 nucleoside triphosphate pyrophosphohydrolase [Nitrospinota bacterium]